MANAFIHGHLMLNVSLLESALERSDHRARKLGVGGSIYGTDGRAEPREGDGIEQWRTVVYDGRGARPHLGGKP
eukprot:CAMPEP_0181212214 /NCGR_PEP_ID=MMETSP1096-20121128/24226_1 /TAXON_ID=156174 ORGANISM="Chrysochromulina ericina, Strain CCMP281" /NCGR_SAMPLE_ID=MMETSP1096 /ASSEMBLY_ACC=CAM_ASM_000453 /LENGTH=73 /DNA_ID=CAMNT_0023303719 /DNA_START=455 /DNA_END=673 /DNA_ORIENTATION=+